MATSLELFCLIGMATNWGLLFSAVDYSTVSLSVVLDALSRGCV